MVNKSGKTLGVIITFFVLILIGIQLLNITADNNSKLSALATVTDDQFTGAATCTQITTGCIDSLTSVENGTGGETVGVGNYTLCRSANTDHQDGIQLSDTEYVGTTLNATYEQSADCMYVSNGTSRILANLIVIFFALGLLGLALYVVMKSDMLDYFK